MNYLRKTMAAVAALLMTSQLAEGADIKGKIADRQTRESLAGATGQVAGGNGAGTAASADGTFCIGGLAGGKRYNLIVRYVSYKTRQIDGVQAEDHPSQDTLAIEMEPDAQTIGEVKVAGMIRRNTEAALIEAAKTSPVIVSNISKRYSAHKTTTRAR